VQQDGTTMKKKYLLLLVAIAVIGVLALVVVLPGPGVTKANFGRIKVGMTFAEVVKIFGERPTWAFHDNELDPSEVREGWVADDWSIAWVGFAQGRVYWLRWEDSNETLWEKLHRWWLLS
jgi:hypothetical protein